eukprot:4948090-Lingulodinium_polyedra.AAC.1
MGPIAVPPKLSGGTRPAARSFFLFGELGRAGAEAVRGAALAGVLARLAPPATVGLRVPLPLHHL